MATQKDSIDYSREAAFNAIQELRRQFENQASFLHKANEAQTRLLIIDRVLKALGWSEEDFNPEEATSGRGYLDYLLTMDQMPRLIVEAKRASQTFKSPTNQLRKFEYRLGYLRSAFGGAFTEALEQAERYGHETGVPYAIVTNGAEWILIQIRLSMGFKDLEDLQATYFGNLLSEGFNFESFWSILYKPYVGEGSLEEHFGQLNCKTADFSITPRTQFGDIQWQNSESDGALRDFYRYFFTDLIDPMRREMLGRCFVSDSRLDQYRGELGRALKDTAPGYIPDAVELPPAERRSLLSSESGDIKGRVILVTGSVGCGKSTLVAKVLVEAKEDKRTKNVHVVVIDLIDEAGVEQDEVASTLWGYVSRKWREVQPSSYKHEALRKIFGRQLKELRHGPYEKVFETDKTELDRKEAELLDQLSVDHESFFRYCWRYYRYRNRGIVVVFDNVDRASENYQRQVYAFAHKLAADTGATIIITMRETTFFRGQQGGFLDVRLGEDIVFHLQTPNLEQILAQRIRYVEQHIDDDHRVATWKKNRDWDTFRSSVMIYADTLKQTFLISESPGPGREILGLLAAISWHDVRYFLSMLCCLHMQLGGDKPWRIPETIAALMTSPEPANIAPILSNIFKPPYPNYLCYFLRIRILLMLIYGLEPHEISHGISYSRILSFARLYGYQRAWIDRAIEEMVQARLLECIEAPSEEDFTAHHYKLSDAHSFRRSPLAVVSVEILATEPIYLSLIGNDLPFHSPTAFDRYRDVREDILRSLKNKLDRDSVDLVIDATDLGRIVITYLVTVFQRDEQPSENLLINSPEIAATERKLREIIQRLCELANLPVGPFRLQGVVSWQPSLFSPECNGVSNGSTGDIPIPENILDMRIGRSALGPLIFWSLVRLRGLGQHISSSTAITDVINMYLVDDQNQKAPTNVARALRHETLQEQEWLETQPGPLYGLNDNWKAFWLRLFGEPLPSFE